MGIKDKYTKNKRTLKRGRLVARRTLRARQERRYLNFPIEFYLIFLDVSWPILVLIAGGWVMRRSALLPQQRRLDEIHREVIATQEERLKQRDRTIVDLEERINHVEEEADIQKKQYVRTLQDKDDALIAIQAALVREKHDADELRAIVADNQLKLGAMVSHQRTEERHVGKD